jgi:tetratricopeptide (TPR) repeat protein
MTRTTGPNPSIGVVLVPLRDIAPPGPLASVDVDDLQRRLDEAAALETSGRLDDAIERYRDILTHVPALTSIHLQLGSLYERTHDTAAARSEYQAILTTDPGNTKARAALDRLVRE